MTMITPSYLGETIEYSSLHACRSTLEDPTENHSGAYAQTVYSPTGFVLENMNGSAYQYGFSPMPGGGATVWSAPANTVYYRHADWLGSSRFASTYTRTMYYDGAYAPFGEMYANTGNTDLSFRVINEFTSWNLYDFPAREYGIQGRWPSPDPAGLDAVDPSNPQSWNRYAYVLNDPLALVDPTGLDCQTFEGITTCSPDPITPNPISLCPPGGTFTGPCSGLPTCPPTGCKSDAQQCVAKALKNGGNAAACAGGHAVPPPPTNCIKSVFNPTCQTPSKPSCPTVFFESLFSYDPHGAAQAPTGHGAEDAATLSAGAFAMRHIIQRGLVVPLRSSIVRNIFLAGEVASEAITYGPILYSEGSALNDEWQDWKTGACSTVWSNN